MRRRLVWIQGAGNTISHNAIIGGATFGASLNRLRPGWKCVDGVCVYSETEGVYATQAECEASRVPIYQFSESIAGGCTVSVNYYLTIQWSAVITNNLGNRREYGDTWTHDVNGNPLQFPGTLIYAPETRLVLTAINPFEQDITVSSIKRSGPGATYYNPNVAMRIPIGNPPFYTDRFESYSINITATRVDGLPETCPPQSGSSGNIIGYNCP